MLRASSTQGGWQHFYVNERNACVVWFPDGGPLNPQFYGAIIGGLGCFLRHQWCSSHGMSRLAEPCLGNIIKCQPWIDRTTGLQRSCQGQRGKGRQTHGPHDVVPPKSSMPLSTSRRLWWSPCRVCRRQARVAPSTRNPLGPTTDSACTTLTSPPARHGDGSVASESSTRQVIFSAFQFNSPNPAGESPAQRYTLKYLPRTTCLPSSTTTLPLRDTGRNSTSKAAVPPVGKEGHQGQDPGRHSLQDSARRG